MRMLICLALLAGCADETIDAIPPSSPEVTVSAVDPFGCRLDGSACRCTIPAYSSEAIAEMSQRCNFLRAIADSLY